MKIKTIKNRLDNNEDFDIEVNEALSKGFTLTRREIILPNQPINGSTFLHTMLYAELVKYDPEDFKKPENE